MMNQESYVNIEDLHKQGWDDQGDRRGDGVSPRDDLPAAPGGARRRRGGWRLMGPR